REFAGQQRTNLVGSRTGPDPVRERLADGGWEPRHHLVEGDGRGRSGGSSDRSGIQLFLFFSSELSSRVAASRAKLGPNVGDPGVRTRLGGGVRVPFARAPKLAPSSVSTFQSKGGEAGGPA